MVRTIDPIKLENIRKAVEDGWPLKQIINTYNTDARIIQKYCNGYRGIPMQEAATLSAPVKRAYK